MIRVHHDEIRILRKRRVYVRIPPPSLMTNQEDTTSEWTLDEGVRAFIYCTAVFSPPYQSSARCAGCSRKNICAGPFHGFHDLFRRSGFCAWFSTTVCTARLRFISADIEASRLCTLSHFFSTVSGPRGRAAFGTTANRRCTCRFPNQTIEDPVVIIGLAMVVSALGATIYMVPRAA